MKITDHKLPEGIALTFRVPEGNIKHPLILLCHGFCGIRNVLLPSFANAFTEAGFATITFDYRGFGESEGERGRLVAKWHLNRSQFGIRIDHDLASISDHSLASQSITIWHASDH